MVGADIGIETSQLYSSQISAKRSETIFWNGPMGLFEIGLFSNGTINIAKSMALSYWKGSRTLIEGGDTLEAIKRARVSESELVMCQLMVALLLGSLQEIRCLELKY